MKRYAQLLITYVLIALAVVFLYAPWGLALRPWDFSILRAGASIICGIALAGTFGAATYLTLKDPDVKLLEPARVTDEGEVIAVLEEYEDAPYVGGIASEALEQVKSAHRKRSRLRKVISIQFAEGSLSWEKFDNLVHTAQRTVLRNAALVANNVQSFDREGYAKARRATKANGGAKATSGTNAQIALYDEALAGMQNVIAANDQVLLEMGKLELELSKLEADDTLDGGSQTVEELQSLIEETRYYR